MTVNPPLQPSRHLSPNAEVSFVPMEAIGEYGGLDLSVQRPLADIGAGYTPFQNGDVIIAKITPCFENGKGALATGLCNGVAFGTTELHVLRASPLLERRYLFYLTLSTGYRKFGEAEMYGAGGQKRVPPEFNKDFRTPVPPFVEQIAIANFLDRKTTEIDTLVTKKRALIEKLKEKRSALISRTVTRGLPPEAARAAGLNPKPKLKHSSIEALGDVPEHWEVLRLKHLLMPKKGAIKAGPFGSQLQSSEMQDRDIKVYNQKNVIERDLEAGENYISLKKFEELTAFEVFPDDLLITTRGTIGRCIILPKGSERGILHPCLMRVQIRQEQCSNRYLELIMQESSVVIEQLRVKSNATTIDVIYSESLKEVWLSCPAIPEQHGIMAFLDRETAKIDSLIAKVEQAIERLQEYRTALITAAVTGKIDVRQTESQPRASVGAAQ